MFFTPIYFFNVCGWVTVECIHYIENNIAHTMRSAQTRGGGGGGNLGGKFFCAMCALNYSGARLIAPSQDDECSLTILCISLCSQ